MPVLIDSAVGGGQSNPSSGSATGSISKTINVNPSATGLVAVVATLWSSDANCSGASFSATFGGDAMTPLGSPIVFNSNKTRLDVFVLQDPPSGPGKSAVVSYSSMPTGGGTRYFWSVAGTYSGVEEIGEAEDANGSGTNQNTVTVDSVLPAHRVVAVHASWNLPEGNWITAYNQTARANGTILTGQPVLLLGDAAGAETVTSTATHMASGTAIWAAKGFNLTPATVVGEAELDLSMGMSTGGTFFRDRTPDARRYWKIDR